MYNKISLMGRLTHAPELKVTQNGIPYVHFRIAVNRRYRAKGEDAEVDFFNVVAWRGTAEFICKYFTKGNMIMLDGEMQSSQYTDKNGNPATWWEVAVDRVCFTGETRRDNSNKGSYNSGNAQNRRSYGNGKSGYGNAYEQAQRIYGKPPVNNAYNDVRDYGDEPPANDDYPF
ncbi:MAG: single-stranded DNA-binding protein [Ruminococcus sp.]|nr:single-stranded DNA-binding protein [Ruminococcus sp.]